MQFSLIKKKLRKTCKSRYFFVFTVLKIFSQTVLEHPLWNWKKKSSNIFRKVYYFRVWKKTKKYHNGCVKKMFVFLPGPFKKINIFCLFYSLEFLYPGSGLRIGSCALPVRNYINVTFSICFISFIISNNPITITTRKNQGRWCFHSFHWLHATGRRIVLSEFLKQLRNSKVDIATNYFIGIVFFKRR